MAAVVDRAAKAGAFVDWLLEHGGYVHPSLNLFAKLPNGDYGVRAEKAIKENEQLLLVRGVACMRGVPSRPDLPWLCSLGQARQPSNRRRCMRSCPRCPSRSASTFATTRAPRAR